MVHFTLEGRQKLHRNHTELQFEVPRYIRRCQIQGKEDKQHFSIQDWLRPEKGCPASFGLLDSDREHMGGQ